MRIVLGLLRWGAIIALLAVVLALMPVLYIETFCRDTARPENRAAVITDRGWQRPEANSYLTYPEWHIVYAYEGLGKTLETGDEWQFDYGSSVGSFWRSFCALNRAANRRGGGDFVTRATIHIIGVSFTFEMAAKALYEETLGRLFAWLRGPDKTAQDRLAATMAAEYGLFLHQTPWYRYDFDGATKALWALPVDDAKRGWERRLALGAEWKAKAVYAKLIGQAAAASGGAQLRIHSVVRGLSDAQLEAIDGVTVVERYGDANTVIETPRYREFTEILSQIAEAGGQIVEIAGNDDIMVSVLVGESYTFTPENGVVIARIARDGRPGARLLVDVRVPALAALIRQLAQSDGTLEHVYDY